MSGEVFLPGVGRTGGFRNETVERLQREAVELGKCFLCAEMFEAKNGYLVEPLDGIILKHWNVWNSPSPHSGTKHHFMVAPKHHHVLESARLSSEAMNELQEIVSALQLKYGYASFALLSRQGEPDFNSSTVFHLHYHIVVSDGLPVSMGVFPPEIVRKAQELWDELDDEEAYDRLREAMDAFRAQKLGKAWPIRVKLSNRTGHNLL